MSKPRRPVAPTNHRYPREERLSPSLRQVLAAAAELATRGEIITLGITPSFPSTGYGYIREGAPLEGFNGAAFSVEAFYEKPDKATAEKYLASGDYYWNSGIFVLNARTYLEEVARLEPQILDEDERYLNYVDIDGVKRTFQKDEGVIPSSREWPIKNWATWLQIKEERLRLDLSLIHISELTRPY